MKEEEEKPSQTQSIKIKSNRIKIVRPNANPERRKASNADHETNEQ